jgi:hypothetical protein
VTTGGLGNGPATEPLDERGTNPMLRVAAPTVDEPAAFAATTRFRFTTGVRAGETIPIRGEGGDAILTYTSFASAIGIVAALMAGIVAVAGAAGTVFLAMEGRALPAIAAAMLAVFFALFIAMLVPPTNVQIAEGDAAALMIAQKSRFAFPRVVYAVMTPQGETLALIHHSIFSRLGRNRWSAYTADDKLRIADAVEESFGRALIRKFAGKFHRRFQSNVRIRSGYETVGWIHRRPDERGEFDVLDLGADTSGMLDRRVAVALATLVLGSEP